MRPNRLRQLLNAGEPSISTHVHISWPSIVEIIGHAGGIDYVEFVAEYAPYDLYALENFGRAVDLFDDLSAMIKVDQELRTYVAQRAIGMGIQNVIFADIRTAEDAEECVSAVRADTPRTGGRYGSADRRFSSLILEAGSPAYVQALEDVVVVLMIEKELAVKNLDAILAVKGVDMVNFGPSDYAMSVGKPEGHHDPEVRKVEEYVFQTALKAGVQPRAEISTPDEARRYLDMGARHFSIGTDLQILFAWWKDNAATLREEITRA